MALDFGDHASGFRHNDVIRFINNEVLMNGGGPEFYIAFRSRPWSEVEDRLQTVVSDPQVPRTIKRACAWSALALSVRIVARQQEQQAYRVRRLQEQVEEWEAATWALVAELQQTRDEREEMAAQLCFTQAALQQALNECDVLRGRLLQAERLAQATSLAHTVPGSQPEQHGSVVWPPNFDQPRDTVAMGGPGRLYFEAQVPAPTAVLHVPGPSGPWAQAVQPPQPMPVLFPFPPPFLVGVPCLQAIPTAVVMETEAVVVPSGTYPLVPWTTAGLQGMIPLWDLDNNIQEGGPEILQGSAPLGDSISHNHQEDQEGSQGLSFLRDSGCHNQESDLKRPQGTAALGISGSCNQEKGPERPQGMAPIGNRESQSLEEDLERPHETVSLGDSWSQSQEETLEKPPETGP
ncbi:Testis-expressed sequence 13A protein [Tupaia chinensis]|uniref:Testis-expressed sequence 13A protein n=2 Tax=Tupaia chinensis TaxID=246437 RepID=L8Y6X8_TUPCH|nr:Testis-expressed sequence 13A protein [Tupaia chinensis]